MSIRTHEASLATENQVELAALCKMLELAQGFTLGFARVNHVTLRERLVEEIRSRLPKKKILEISLDPKSDYDILGQLEQLVREQRPDACFLYGLDSMLDLRMRQSPAMDLLNLNRDCFGKRSPWPVVFWLADFGAREIRRQAPDFWSWRSGIYHFIGESEDARATLRTVQEDFDWSLGLREKRERREILQHILAELEKSRQRDPGSLATVLRLLGDAASFEGVQTNAAGFYERALGCYRKLGDRLGEANCVKSLGDVARMQDRYEEAGRLYSQALPIHRQIGDRLGEAACLVSMGRLARATGDAGAMRTAYEEAERIYSSIGLDDRARRAREEAAALVP